MNLFKIALTIAGMAVYSDSMAAFHGNSGLSGATAETNINHMTMDTIRPNQTIIDLAGHQVPVVKDGLYDRFRSNPRYRH
ncbi:hypothetical protein EJ377_17080 [Chryseobacterium arthrosphaerae]|uniref:Uncharacterized protein n=1 Tax=Chryseobacterium arthrosphaerae TaxID=651561 RepID=A0A432DSN1_9FLAO|nr:hypothetical protein EJ377_17080 [Chryseobacterium arthrosphaerae]